MAARSNIKVQGVKTVLKALHASGRKDRMNMADGLRKCAEIVLKKSQEFVPVDTGSLKDSGRIETVGKGLEARSYVIYGGKNFTRKRETYTVGAPGFERTKTRYKFPKNPLYAWIVHERMDLKHKPPTKAKYLSDAVKATHARMVTTMRWKMKSKTFGVVGGGEETTI